MNNETISIVRLTKNNFGENSLDNYNRRHDVTEVYRKINNEYVLVEQPYVEDWDLEKKRQVAADIGSDKYISYLALAGDEIAGFIGLIKELHGKRMILDVMHVSADHRRCGVGKKLFETAKAEAALAGAEELYISACSSKETISFYRAMGAEITDEPITAIAEDEPFDLQMTCKIN